MKKRKHCVLCEQIRWNKITNNTEDVERRK
jgi:hypothetical protein